MTFFGIENDNYTAEKNDQKLDQKKPFII